jgi:hypothetical protein
VLLSRGLSGDELVSGPAEGREAAYDGDADPDFSGLAVRGLMSRFVFAGNCIQVG